MEQKLPGKAGLQSGSQSRRCIHLHGTFIFNTTKRIKLLFIVQSLLHRNSLNIWIKINKIVIQIKSLHGTKLLNPESDPDEFTPCKQGITFKMEDL